MKDWLFFCPVSNRVGKSYHEFYKGKWDNKTFWKSDSILLHDDTLTKLELHKAFTAVIPDYDPCRTTEVNESQWRAILDCASQLDTQAKIALREAAIWVNEVFSTEKVFTILSI